MTERVFVALGSVKAAGVSAAGDLPDLISGRRASPLQAVTVAGEEIRLGEDVALDRGSPFYPNRSHEKIMRKEVIAAALGACELLSEAALSGARADVPLFVASGVTMDRQQADLDWLEKAFEAAREGVSPEERNRRLGHVTPPLLALRTLTNAVSSFVAERTGVTGNNTTFGCTSQSGLHALAQGFAAVSSGAAACALVGGASRGGIASYLMYRNFFPDRSDWRESLAAAFLLLESGTSLEARGGAALCEIVEVSASSCPPALSRPAGTPFAEHTADAASADLAVFGGAFCRREHQQLAAAVGASWRTSASLFEALGNTGPANLFLAVLAAVKLLGGAGTADCLDHDPYGRDSFVRIRAAAA